VAAARVEDAAMSGEPRGTPPDPAGIGAGGPSPAGGDPQPPAGRRPDPSTTGPPDWDRLSGWDDDPGAIGIRDLAGAEDGWPPASEAGAWDGWPPVGDHGSSDAVQPRRGWARSDGAVGRQRARGLREGSWRDRPAVRFGLFGLAVTLAAAAVASAWPGTPRERDAGPAAAARDAGPVPSRSAYSFVPPARWRDATRVLGPRFPGARPDVVLVGPAAAGSGANLSVVRTGAGRAPPPLTALPAAALRRLHAGARLAGGARWLTLAGEPAVAADYTLAQGGGRLHARQVACYHLGDLYLVTLTAEAGAFLTQAPAQDQVLRSWRWT
jgi:hypothetical protein